MLPILIVAWCIITMLVKIISVFLNKKIPHGTRYFYWFSSLILVGSSRDSGRANATAVSEAARAQLRRNEELKQLIGRYVDSFHGIGSVHVRELLSDEYSHDTGSSTLQVEGDGWKRRDFASHTWEV